MEFLKLVGSGNDFVVTDNRAGKITGRSGLARKVCDRKFGVGADGLVLIEPSRKADFRMRIFNPDGSEAEMCGNGLRCAARFIFERRLSRKAVLMIEAKAGLYRAQAKGERVTVSMHLVEPPRLNIAVPLPSGDLTAHYVNTGVPHAVIFVDDLAGVDLPGTGAAVRYHDLFRPRGTNVDWVEVTGRRAIRMRTYERGVEGETLSCGTGTVACAVIGFALGRIESPVTVMAASGETLTVDFNRDFSDISLAGKTHFPFSGVWRK